MTPPNIGERTGSRKESFVPRPVGSPPDGAPAEDAQSAARTTWKAMPRMAATPMANEIVRNGCLPHR